MAVIEQTAFRVIKHETINSATPELGDFAEILCTTLHPGKKKTSLN